MRLYHFLSASNAIDDVAKRRIKVSCYRDCNDPWELLPFDLSDTVQRRALEGLKAELNSQNAIVCMCKDWRNPLMWAHYAENHKGIALGFDVQDEFCTSIRYVPTVYEIPPSGPVNIGLRILNDGRRLIDVSLDTKFDGWKYEGEVRVFAPLDGSNVEGGLEFMPFSARTVLLREVILGERCPLSIAQFRSSVGHIDSGVSIIKARRAIHAFCLEPDPTAI